MIKIVNIENDLITDIKIGHTKDLACIKKINHPIYGESLLTAAQDRTVKIWSIE